MTNNFSKEYADEHIEEFYNRITKEMQGSTLFGEPVDIFNPKHVALACYCMGQKSAYKDNELTHHMLETLRRPKNMLGF